MLKGWGRENILELFDTSEPSCQYGHINLEGFLLAVHQNPMFAKAETLGSFLQFDAFLVNFFIKFLGHC